MEQQEEEKQNQAGPSEKEVDDIKEFGLYTPKTKNPRGNIFYLTIIGHIEGHNVMPPSTKATKYEHVIPMLFEVAENPEIDGLLVTLNTVGGDVEAGLAIAELISGLGKPTVSLVLGGGHSIGVPLAVAAQYSFIAPSATMTVHPVRMSGTLVGAPQTYDYFAKMQERVSNFITGNSKIDENRLTELMFDTKQFALDVGTMLIGEEAVEEGIINEVGNLFSAREKLFELIANYRSEEEIS